MRKVYLHIGMPKTGTSSIQSFMVSNQRALLSQGYVYKRMPWDYMDASRKRNAHFLVKRMYDENGKNDVAAFEERRNEGWAIIDKWFKEGDNIILTDEGIWKMFASRNIIEDTMQRCRERDAQLVVVVYLRSQDDFVESYYAQKIEEGWRSQPWGDKYLKKITREHQLDYRVALEKIEDIVGKENVKPRVFDRGAFVGGSVIQDFLETIGVEYTDEFEELEEEKNITLIPELVEIKRAMNNILGGNYYANKGPEWRMLQLLVNDTHARINQTKPQPKRTLFTAEQRAAFMEQFAESNSWVAQRYLGRDELFPNRTDEKTIFALDNKRQIDVLAQVVATIALKNERLLNELDEKYKVNASQIEGVKNAKKETFTYRVKRKVKKILGRY